MKSRRCGDVSGLAGSGAEAASGARAASLLHAIGRSPAGIIQLGFACAHVIKELLQQHIAT